MKKYQKILLMYVLPALIIFPLVMFLVWVFTPKTKLVAAIVDKTSLDESGQEHISLTWVLNHYRYTKTPDEGYSVGHDYFGFFPKDDEKFRLKGLERFSSDQLRQLSDDADLAYYTDTYGVYKNDWYTAKGETGQKGLLYGGLSSQDVEFLQDMKNRHKLIITEFNTIGSPTNADNRNKFEKMFGMHWTGWTARFFDSFDTLKNKELPAWLVTNYKKEHAQKWPFHKAGLAFVNDAGNVVILEDSTHLTNPVPRIITFKYGQKELSLPENMKYPFWFDIITPSLSVNHAVSLFDLNLNTNGAAELKKNGIPTMFPAITMHKGADYQFYYFSGDFCDNPIGMTSSYFRGISFFRWMFYNSDDPAERKSFFWTFYRPMITRILKDEATGKNHSSLNNVASAR
ncbi:MAG: hypothetical protein JST32_04120 [Bacteroidetes bacterium]|nr:hypothetical protein [Bacteroidota bacterium]